MNKIKKVIALIFAAVMVLAMSVPTFAAADYSITVNNAKAGETYTAYKMFDLSVDDPENPTAYRYTVNSAWTNFANTDEFKAVYTVDSQGYVTSTVSSEESWSATSTLSTLAEKAAAYAKTNNITAAGSVTIATGATSGKINLTGAGYYVVSSTLGTRAMIDTTPANPAVTMNEKNDSDTITKNVKEDSTGVYGTSNDAQIGDTIEFKSVANIAARSINVKVHDTMDEGLTFSGNSSIKIYTDADLTQELAAAQYEIKSTPDSGDTFTIEIKDTFAATASSTQSLYITYAAVLNNKAVVNKAIVDKHNKTKLTFGDGQSVESQTTTTTHKFEVLKYKTGDTSKANLAGAVFQLKKNKTVVNLIKIDDTNYRVADATEKTGTASSHANDGELNTIAANNLVSDFVTVSSGNIVIWGVDSDNDYTLYEVQAPSGYNALASEQSVTVSAENTTVSEIGNATGTELPTTGGIGTTIFYIVGAILVVGAGIVLISRRRMNDR